MAAAKPHQLLAISQIRIMIYLLSPPTHVQSPFCPEDPGPIEFPAVETPALAPDRFDGGTLRPCGAGGNDALARSSGNLRCSREYLHQHIRGNDDQRRRGIYHGTGRDSRRRACALRIRRPLCFGRHRSGHRPLFPGFPTVHLHVPVRSNQPLHGYDTRSSRRVCSRRVLQHGSDECGRSAYPQR